MRKKRILFVLFAGLIFAAPASAALVNFDDLNPPPIGTVPVNYKGFIWGPDPSPWVFIDNSIYQTFGSTFNVPSVPNAASPWNGAGSATISSLTKFNFLSASFSTWTDGAGNYLPTSTREITVTGYRGGIGGTLVATVDIPIPPGGFFPQAINLLNVDTLVFLDVTPGHPGSNNWLMDNFEYTPVPLPTTLLLLGSGLIGLVGIRRKFQS